MSADDEKSSEEILNELFSTINGPSETAEVDTQSKKYHICDF